MSKLIDLTGNKYGRLLVIKKVKKPEHLKGKKLNAFWLCRCDCGNEKIINGNSLKRKVTVSCGCYNREKSKTRKYGTNEESSKGDKYSQYKHSAKRRNIDFQLSKEEFFNIISKNCFYCGEKPSNIYKNRSDGNNYLYSGIDRIDSSKGYITKNIVPCCSICNHAKNNMGINDFYKWIDKISSYKNVRM